MRDSAGKFLIFALLFFLSCSAPRTLKNPLPRIAVWPQFYQKNFQAVKNLSSQARISVESTSMATTFSAKIIYAAPHTLFMQAEGPLGLDVGKFFIGKNRFIVYNQYQNNFISGRLEESYYNTFLETGLSFDEIKNAVVGYVRLPENLQLVDDRNGIFAALVNGEKWRYQVNPSTGALQRFEIHRDDEIVFYQEFENYRRDHGILLPGLIRVVQPVKKEMVAIFHKNMKINQELNPGQYRVIINPKVEQLILSE
ncbi:MAG: DUF4292 domain-containing protein [Calditrichia bacterium]